MDEGAMTGGGGGGAARVVRSQVGVRGTGKTWRMEEVEE